MKRVTLYLLAEQVSRLKRLAAERNISYAALIREILAEWLEANS